MGEYVLCASQIIISSLQSVCTCEKCSDKCDKCMPCYRVGGNARPWEKVQKKWSDLKSKAVTTYNRYQRACNATGGGKEPDPPKYNKWEQLIIDLLIERKSNLLSGLKDGFDTGVRFN